MRIISGVVIGTVLCFAMPALACGPEVIVRFQEASPDRFQIVFERGPKLELVSLTITLDGSAAGAMFDNFEGLRGQGPQPGRGGVAITSVTYRTQTGQSVDIGFEGFVEKRTADFRTDLDDRGRAADLDYNHIADGEIEGAHATAVLKNAGGRVVEINGRFDRKGQALLGERACV